MPLPIRTVQAFHVFNLSLFESYVVVDCRAEEEYSLGHIATSLSCPAPTTISPDEYHLLRSPLLNAFCDAVGQIMPDFFSPLVLVHNNNSPSKPFACFLAEMIVQYIDHCLTPSDYDAHASDGSCPVGKVEILRSRDFVLHRLLKCEQVWLLNYEDFSSEFSFLCDPTLTIHTITNTPRIICPELLVGVNEFLLECVKQLPRITHIICHESPKLWAELSDKVVFITSDVQNHTRDLSHLWSASVRIIREAKQVGGCTLIYVHGRSISSSCAVAYLVAELGWSFEAAMAFVSQILPSVSRLAIELQLWARVYDKPQPKKTIA